MLIIKSNNKAKIDVKKLKKAIDKKSYNFRTNTAIRGKNKPPVYQIAKSFGSPEDYEFCCECGFSFSFHDDKKIVEFSAYSEGGMCGFTFDESDLKNKNINKYEKECMEELIKTYKSLKKDKIII